MEAYGNDAVRLVAASLIPSSLTEENVAKLARSNKNKTTNFSKYRIKYRFKKRGAKKIILN